MREREEDYRVRTSQEIDVYKQCLDVHQLPGIFHYWSHNKIRPKLEAFGFASSAEMFRNYLEEQCRRERFRTRRFVSIGSGNCELEIGLARQLVSAGYSHFVIDCLDINPAALERGRTAAREHGVEAHIRCLKGDFNRWAPECEYDAVLACHALHHVVNLEGLFGQVRDALAPHGRFIISDIIGRNGHRRWPEALQLVREFWLELPPSYRYNRVRQVEEEFFINRDASTEGFEGIRSQDILPLLLKNFHFQLIVAYGNLMDPFVDRPFGHNFNAAAEWDRDFIDRVHQRDEQEMLAGRIKPCHMEAVVSKEHAEPTLFHPPFSPEFCVRWPDPMQPASDASDRTEYELLRVLDERADLERRVDELQGILRAAADSRWVRLGRLFGLGPKLR